MEKEDDYKNFMKFTPSVTGKNKIQLLTQDKKDVGEYKIRIRVELMKYKVVAPKYIKFTVTIKGCEPKEFVPVFQMNNRIVTWKLQLPEDVR